MRQHFPPIFPANFFLSLLKNALKVLALSHFRSLLRRIRSIVAMIGHQPIRVNFGNFLAIRHRLSSSVRNCDTTTRHHYCALRFRTSDPILHLCTHFILHPPVAHDIRFLTGRTPAQTDEALGKDARFQKLIAKS